jgi:hypothetical protein
MCMAVNYGRVVKFRPSRKKHALMCTIHEQDKVSVLYHVLCTLSNVRFFYMTMFNIVIILKIINLLTIYRKCTPRTENPITWYSTM